MLLEGLSLIKPDYAVYIQSGESVPVKYLELYYKLKHVSKTPSATKGVL